MAEITREAINACLKRVNIRGKEYVEVAQRIQGFWQLYPNGAIRTQAIECDAKHALFRAEVFESATTSEKPKATGYAWEVAGNGVNRTSHVENCETSAIGRALGMLGIGSTDSIASADEVNNAIAGQQATQGAQAPQAPAQAPQAPAHQESEETKAYKRLQAACAAYEAQSTSEQEAGWALAGVAKRPDLPPKGAPNRAEWFSAVAAEFEAELKA